MSTAAEAEAASAGAIAIVGMAGRFPGAPDLKRYWEIIVSGTETIRDLSDAELLAAGVEPKLIADPSYVKRAALLDGFAAFDGEFFGFAPSEAARLDPQQRVFLELAAACLEAAGYDPSRYPGSIGVFASEGFNGYLATTVEGSEDVPRLLSTGRAAPLILANDKDFLTTRVSYKLGLSGPSIDVQSACSSSLVAVWLAMQSLLTYGCDMALAGGVSIRIPHGTGYLPLPNGAVSPDGRCRPFDRDAAGTVRGSGAGVVLLKRLGDAIADRDTIRAVIRGGAVNNDGADKVGFTAPSVSGQARVIATANALAEINARSIGYVEAHGTGTKLGDPIEILSLAQAYSRDTQDRAFCGLGSVKANIGHLDAAAGIAGLIKAALALEHATIPPSVHLNAPNPELRLEATPFFGPRTAKPWPRAETPRRAGVSSFGMGGTNAHVVLEEAPTRQKEAHSTHGELLVLSAKTAEALARMRKALAERLAAEPRLSLSDVAYTLQIGRKRYPHRYAGAGADLREAIEQLTSGGATHSVDPERETPPRVAFAFPDQGASLAASPVLFASEAVYRRSVEAALAALEPALRDRVHARLVSSAPATAPQDVEHPALLIASLALANLWRAWGVRPDAVIGHGLGEFAAACCAGALDVTDALALVCGRWEIRTPAGNGRALTSRFLSTVSGEWLTGPELVTPSYWRAHLRRPVQSAPAVAELAKQGYDVLVEIGFDGALTRGIRVDRSGQARPSVIASIQREREPARARAELLRALGELWLRGADVSWDAVHGEAKPWRVELPTYPFVRSVHWLDPATPPREARSQEGLTALLWRQAPAPDASPAPERRLVLGDDGAATAALLRALGLHASDTNCLIAAGSATRRVGTSSWTLDLDRPLDIDAVLSEAAGAAQEIDLVVLWTLEAQRADLREAVRHALLALCRGCAGRKLRVELVTYGLADFPSPAPLANSAALLFAWAEQLRRSGVACRLIDLGAPFTPASARDLGREISAPSEHDLVVLLHGRRFLQQAEPLTPTGSFEPGTLRILGSARAGLTALAAELARAGFAPQLEELGARSSEPDGAGQSRPRIVASSDVRDYRTRAASTDRLVSALLAETLNGVEVATEAGPRALGAGVRCSRAALVHAFQVQPRYERLFDFALDALLEDGLLLRDATHLIVASEWDQRAPSAALLETLAHEQPDLEALGVLVARSVSHYRGVWSGEVSGLEVLFGNGSAALDAGMRASEQHGTLRAATAHAADFVAALAPAAATGLRVLEVGVGRGRFARLVGRRLEGRSEAYWITDLSPAFLDAARAWAPEAGISNAHFARFDIGVSPVRQDIPLEWFDVVVALNVLHAVPDLREALANLRATLRPGGRLIVVEHVRHERWVNAVWGLAPGWWSFRDGLRERSPLLSQAAWSRLLESESFAPEVESESSARADTALLVARRTAPSSAISDLTRELERVRREVASASRPETLVWILGDEFAEDALATVDLAELEALSAALGALDEELHSGRLERAVVIAAPSAPASIRTLTQRWAALADHGRVSWCRIAAGAMHDARELGALVLRALATRGAPVLVWSGGPCGAELAIAKPAAAAERSPKLQPRPALSHPFVPPEGELELELARVFCATLGIADVGATDGFFELGGDSLLGLSLIEQLKQQVSPDLNDVDLYAFPTVRDFARLIAGSAQSSQVRAARDAGAERRRRLKQHGPISRREVR